MFKRRKSAVLVAFALAVASGFTFASQAGAAPTPSSNACSNNIDTNLREIDGTQNGTSPAAVPANSALTLSGISINGTVPPAVFVAGYNLNLINNGDTVPGNAREQIDGTNTTQGTQQTATVPIAVGPVVIHDPDGVRGSGDESADPAPFTATFPDMNWTAGPSGTILFREDTVLPFPPAPGTGGLLVHAFVGPGGIITAEFRCDPGTVTGPDPGTPTIQDPGPTFTSTQIDAFAPVANAGPDQTIQEPPSGQTVTLDASASNDGDLPNDTLTYAWTAPAGITLSDPTAVMPTFTAPAAPATLTFGLTVTDQVGQTSTDSVMVTVNPPVAPPNVDATGTATASGPLKAGATTKGYKLKVGNVGTNPFTINPTEGTGQITGSVTVNGAPNGTVVSTSTHTKTINVGRSSSFGLKWTGGPLVSGDTVVLTGCVNPDPALFTEVNPADNCGSVTRIIS